MQAYCITNTQARNFLLLKHGLIDDYKFVGKQGVLDFVKQVGCIQFDPIDVCGKNPELVLQSRIKGFRKEMLYELLYEDRELIDYFDKNLAIMQTSDWKNFARIRDGYQNDGRSRELVDKVSNEIKATIRQNGVVCSKDIGLDEKVDWYWSNTKLSRAALETMYFRGDLVVHHKKGTIKYYDLAENCIPKTILEEKDTFLNEHEYTKWRVLRRISAVGLLWNKASDAWLNIGLKAKERDTIFQELLEENQIIEVSVNGLKEKLYCLSSDSELINFVLESPKLKERCEFIAPLDNLLWDRKLIKALFNFDYKWEIYTPEKDRKYGHYVLPILLGNRFIGRIEAICDKKNKVLIIKNIWYENNIKQTKTMKKQIQHCCERLAKFNHCEKIDTNFLV